MVKKESLMKNYYILYTIFLLLFSSALYAEGATSIKQPSIKSLIEQVKSAKVQDRRILMNQLKLQLRKMNKESRHSAMVELKKSFSKEHGEKKLHRGQHKHKKLYKHRGEHQPMYRHLRQQQERMQRQGEHRGEGNGHK
jgi:Skp family chaperone for outer membrane proteins